MFLVFLFGGPTILLARQIYFAKNVVYIFVLAYVWDHLVTYRPLSLPVLSVHCASVSYRYRTMDCF
jgi:hypothetical protein